MQHAVQVTTPPAAGRRDRPSRAQIQPAALALLARHSAGLLATARRYSASPEDAEDAYQRGVEILLTKAPTTSEAELLPWLKTVVKHEAFAVRQAHGRAYPKHGPGDDFADPEAWTDERAERYEQLRVGAEAMANLKPQELRCLLLRAEGLSYREICDATGWSYTKVNRCITEGRRAFLRRVTSIETGAECERLTPLISKAADGEASVQELALVRPHLKRCLSCRSTLREYRATPARIAGLVPPLAALTNPATGVRLLARVAHFFGQKTAVAASAVVLAGGGAAGVETFHHDAPPVPRSAFAQRADHAARTQAAAPATVAAALPAAADPDPFVAAPRGAADPPRESAPAPAADRAPEFDPGAAAQPASPPAPSAAKEQPAPGPAEFGP